MIRYLNKYRLKTIIELYSNKKYTRLIAIASSYERTKNKDFRIEILRYTGLSYYKLKKFDEAIIYFRKVTTLGNYRTDWFNLAMSHAWKGEGELGDQAFSKIYGAKTINAYKYQVSVANMLFLFSKVLFQNGVSDIALKRLSELKQMYKAANTGDVNKLIQQGFPPVNAFLDLAEKVLNAEEKNMEQWLVELPKIKSHFKNTDSINGSNRSSN